MKLSWMLFCLTAALLAFAYSSHGVLSAPKEAQTAQAAVGIAGTYKSVAEGRVATISISPTQTAGTVNVDISSVGPEAARDCHFNFDAPVSDGILQFTSKTNTGCIIKMEFLIGRLKLFSTSECNNPNAKADLSGNCEGGAFLINGSYEKTSDTPFMPG